ncbi:MAG TPA: bifunctional phosphopantothenoylcysteine decarboxylase/phosphopantothenate--cysteine ligase CoaBC [Saprospiraceae bacterium]|nr:bifunctional phosphopantothenoylcysteine decarboxylase/phosphopantothenate--cysteine ligase CoaBC [Saprospiraceae bacterium]HMQ83700.1 bifunctional phosphopantothenoylcysteine decarboxylase/phosphopantothenate--cysteine ligase CoaBC [Saprospiraceae bacterium]
MERMRLRGKKIILAISGSIAAYKAAFLTRLLIKNGAEVQVLMTSAATDFIAPLTLSTLSKRPVFCEVSSETGWNNHVELGLWADAFVVAPATATTLAKMAQGICDNMVVAAYLSARCPVFFAPAMDIDMWVHPATQTNVQNLLSYGNHLIPVGHGELASGLVGDGRMAEPEDIVTQLIRFFDKDTPLAGKKILITAGPTYEPIDPVRFIGNRSSGKMGLAIAEEAARRGAIVDLILGPSRLDSQQLGLNITRIQTAQEMYEAATALFPQSDIAILSAAVSDYRPAEVAQEKIKKQSDNLQLNLVKNPDIAASLGAIKQAHQYIVGFALETNNEEENARTKLEKKNFDFIVLNSLQDTGAGFNHDTNKIKILRKDNKIRTFELKSKTAVAADILNELESLFSSIQ